MKINPIGLALVFTALVFTSGMCLSQETGASPTQERSFDYAGRDAGDCHLNSGRLTIRSNGSGTWDATLYTRRTGNADFWHTKFYFNNSSNRASGSLPQWDSPAMRGSPSPVVTWHVDFTFDAYSYTQWIYAVPLFNC